MNSRNGRATRAIFDAGLTSQKVTKPQEDPATVAPKHTAGPWRLSKNEKVWRTVYAFEGGVAVADVIDMEGCGEEPGESLANARLISAAPQLLEACRELLRTHVPWCGDTNGAESKARLAIAKAEGGM